MVVKPKVIAVLLVLSMVGCTQPEVKPPADVERIQAIDSFLDELRYKVQAKDVSGLVVLYPQDQQEDVRVLTNAIHSLTEPQLKFYIDRILLVQDTVKVALHWELTWEKATDSKSETRRGNSTFIIKGDPDLFLENLEGDNPFFAPLMETMLSP